MKEIIQQVLKESLESRKVVSAKEASPQNVAFWKSQGLLPCMVRNDDEGFNFIVLEKGYTLSMSKADGMDFPAVYLLTQEQFEHADSLFDKIHSLWEKYVNQAETMVNLFQSTLSHNIVNNKFPGNGKSETNN
jgi:hypothetical protein